MNLLRYNPFPRTTWIMLFLAFATGFFVGAVVESIALQKNRENTCNFIWHEKQQNKRWFFL